MHGRFTATGLPPTAIPPPHPRPRMRGTCGGIFDAVGRQTGSPFLMFAPVEANPHPPPAPEGGSEESEQKDQFSAARRASGWSFR